MKISVLYSSDNNYAKYCGVSLISLLENNKEIDEICVYIIDHNIDLDNKKKYMDIVKYYNRELVFISGEKIKDKLNKKDEFPLAAYGRLFISNIIANDKILYLDCDTIINSSIKELWQTNLNEYLVAGVQDNPAIFNAQIIGMGIKDRYINTGVMLINLYLWRKLNIEEKFREFIDAFKGTVPHHDQGIINGVCKDKIYILKPKFNLMPQFLYLNRTKIMRLYNLDIFYTDLEIQEATKNPVVIHYISKFYNRPWNKECTHPYKDMYMKYLKMSPWDIELVSSPLKREVQFRKLLLDKLPFELYHLVEKVLDIKRKKYLLSNYPTKEKNKGL